VILLYLEYGGFERRVFCVKLSKILQKLSSFWRAESGKNTSFREWFAKFKSNVSSVEDGEHLRVRKTHVNVDYVKEFTLLNKRITTCEVTNMWGFHFRQMIWEEGLRRLVSVP
jgi:hypothetical protein